MRLEWDKMGEKLFEAGVSKGVFFPVRGSGKAWNGLVSVSENPSGGEPNAIYADNIKYLNLISYEDYGLTIEAYDSPEGFNECVGESELAAGVFIQGQPRKSFGFSWRSEIGNDTNGIDYGYKLHLVFICQAQPSEKNHETVSDSVEPQTNSWEIGTTPVVIDSLSGYKPTAEVTFNSVELSKCGVYNLLEAIESIIYGNEKDNARLPNINEIITIISQTMYLRDSSGDYILDSSGNQIQSFVID